VSWGDLALQVDRWRQDPVVRGGVAAPWQPRTLSRIEVTDLLPALWPETADTLPIGRAEAMSIPAIARARTIVCSTIARLPLRIRPADWGGRRSLIDQPEPDRPRYSTLRDTVDDLLFHGSAVWMVLDRDATTGRPVSARWVPRTSVEAAARDGWWSVVSGTGAVEVHGRDLIWFDGPHDGILNFGARTLRMALRLDRAAAGRAINPVPAMELHQTSDDILTDDEISQLIRSWEKALTTGAGVAFTNKSIEARPHGAQPEQLLLQGRNASSVEAARLIGVPALLVDAVTPGFSSTYQTVAEQGRALVDHGLAGYMTAIDARLSMDDILPRGVWCEFDPDRITRPPLAERMGAYATGIAAGVLTVEECRAYERGVDPNEETT
jgi:hypothetical protein